MDNALPLVAKAKVGKAKFPDVVFQRKTLRSGVSFFYELAYVLEVLPRRCWNILKSIRTLEAQQV